MQKIKRVILMTDASAGYDRGIIRGIARYSHLHGPWIFHRRPDDRRSGDIFQKDSWREERLGLHNWGADGVIARLTESKRSRDIMAMGLPTIVVNTKERIPNLPNIITNDVAIGKIGAEHLIDHGFRNFAFCGFDQIDWSSARANGFAQTVAKIGFDISFYNKPRPQVCDSWTKEQIFMAEWLKSLPEPTGLMACNDDRARDVIETCKIAGLRVPEQIAILGVDNDEVFCNLSYPSLSSIALNTEKAGYEAAKLLDRLMTRKKTARRDIVVQPTHVITRQSTDILAIQDHVVAQAVSFIRQHAKEKIQATEVADALAVSRQFLHKRFLKTLSRSVHDEIRRVRVEHIARMLLETNLSISNIASELGYHDADHIARYFRKEKGVSPQTYRDRHALK